MRRLSWMRALVIGCHLVMPGLAHAQGRGGLNGGWGGIDLLLHPVVQKELKLDPEQVKQARDLSIRMGEKQRVLFASLEGLAGDLRTRRARDLAAEHAEDGMKALAGFLKPEQLERFKEVDLQQRGASALVEPPVAEALTLTPEQLGKIQLILNHTVLAMREALSSTRGDRRASTAKIQAIRKDSDDQAIAMLTESQKATWTKMTGAPLDLNPTSQARK